MSSESGLQVSMKISKKVALDMQNAPRGMFNIVIPKLQKSYVSDVKPFFEIDQRSYEFNVLTSFILGDQDANLGNFLFSNDDDKVYNIDHEVMMPESNKSVDFEMPIATKASINIDTGKIDAEETIPFIIRDICPINNCLIGLPMANNVFSRDTINHVLGHLSVKVFKEYHENKSVFNEAQVSAQLERIQLLRDLFQAEYDKPDITLTPRELYLKLVGEHPTYKLLKETFGLADYFLFQFLGKVPANVNDEAVKVLKERMTADAAVNIQKQLPKAVFTRKIKTASEIKDMEDPNFGAANVLLQMVQMQETQKWWNEEENLYYLIHGKKMEQKKEEVQPPRFNPLMGRRFFY